MPRSQKQTGNKRKLTRRTVISAGSATVAAAVAGSVAFQTGWLTKFYLWLAYPEPNAGPTGFLGGELSGTLRVVADTVLGDGRAADRAIRMLDARAQELEGHLALQRNFAAWLDEGSRRAGAESFQTASRDTRVDLLTTCMRLRSKSDLRRAWYGAVFRDRVLWDRQILQPMLELYSHSDAWLDLGYDSFPGDPSGLDSYQEAPLTHSTVGTSENRS